MWAIIMFAIALILHLLMIWQRHLPVFGLVAVWAFIAIAAANKLVNSTVYAAAIMAAIIVLLNVIVYYIQYRKRQPF